MSQAMQAEQARSDVARQAQVDCVTNVVQHADDLNQVQMSGGATTSDNTSTHAVRQASIDSSSTPFGESLSMLSACLLKTVWYTCEDKYTWYCYHAPGVCNRRVAWSRFQNNHASVFY